MKVSVNGKKDLYVKNVQRTIMECVPSSSTIVYMQCIASFHCSYTWHMSLLVLTWNKPYLNPIHVVGTGNLIDDNYWQGDHHWQKNQVPGSRSFTPRKLVLNAFFSIRSSRSVNEVTRVAGDMERIRAFCQIWVSELRVMLHETKDCVNDFMIKVYGQTGRDQKQSIVEFGSELENVNSSPAKQSQLHANCLSIKAPQMHGHPPVYHPERLIFRDLERCYGLLPYLPNSVHIPYTRELYQRGHICRPPFGAHFLQLIFERPAAGWQRRKEELEGGVLQRSFLEGVLDAEKTRNQRVIFFWGILSWRELQVGSLRRKPEVSGKSLSGKQAVLSSLEDSEKRPPESEGLEGEDNGSHSSLGDSVLDTAGTEFEKTEKEAPKEKAGASEDPESKEVEMDDWLFGFTQLFRTHVGIDLDAHIDLHELGMELCSEALEETVTSEEAQASRKRIPLDESATKDVMATQLQVAYDWSFALAKKLDLSGWDATETIKLFDSAEEKVKAKTEVQSPSFQGYSFAEEGKVLEDGRGSMRSLLRYLEEEVLHQDLDLVPHGGGRGRYLAKEPDEFVRLLQP
ncbi:Protein CLMP1 [Vitis vinifera]|uniref:Protein CLMP1 n=1 Tax=Vitis vinifera TaxID=29760 RepID=A0A438C6P6_VITVI|nr:Protein CLMP1 [Vitis vinifera]